MELELIKTIFFYLENPDNLYAILAIGILLLVIEFSATGGFVLGVAGSLITAYAFWLLGYYWALIFSFAALVAVVYLGFEAFGQKKAEDLMNGSIVAVSMPIDPVGKVIYKGEIWNAKSDDRILDGDAKIVGKDGLMLIVKAIE